ncbi:MAG: exopolysaccharide biosynthesis polyprenyl glycosylphosphotransferase [Patescibacteria group bacterium]|jgi:exopolysaccharide biosynthesis polyprenyl glycosylphosphotransferase
MFNSWKKFILFLGDLTGLHLALLLTLIIRYPQALWANNWQNHWFNFLPVFIIWLLILYINDLYNLNLKVASRQFLGRLSNTTIVSSLLAIIYFYLKVSSTITPKTNLAIFSVIFLVIFFIFRAAFQAIIHSSKLKENLALIGFNAKTEKLLAELQNNPGAGYQTALIFKSEEEIASLVENIKNKNIHTIVVCDDFGLGADLSDTLFNCLAYNINFFNYPDFYELITGKIPVEAIDQNWFLKNLQEGQKNYFNFIKQLLDFLLALIILIISLPVWPLIAGIIKLTSRGSVFFRQARSGKNEKIFNILKFRTMREENNDRSLTLEGDKRITRFGSFLRRTRLDEIPQVLNILKGEMSFIGPRPERPEIIAELEKQIPFYKTRLLIKPGLTGWDQISGHYHSPSLEDSLEKLQYDLYYLRHRSIYLDISITLKTLATMMSRGGR